MIKFECVHQHGVKLSELKVGVYFRLFGRPEEHGLYLKYSNKIYINLNTVISYPIDRQAMSLYVKPVKILEVKYANIEGDLESYVEPFTEEAMDRRS